MSGQSDFKTEQEAFWAGEFGNNYIDRNKDERLVTNNLVMFSNIFRSISNVKSVVELGCNIGNNLRALRLLDPQLELSGYEINERAATLARATGATILNGTILQDLSSAKKFDVALIKGVLIHINPDHLSTIYENLFNLSNKYIVLCEYYNPSPVEVSYRGHSKRLFKRDFAGEMMDKYQVGLVDYGFVYHKDTLFPQDDLTWFLLEKN